MEANTNGTKTVYYSAGKGGREIEGCFTTRERAEADVWERNYYIGAVVRHQVSDTEYAEIESQEAGEDAEAIDWCEPTQLDKYRACMQGISEITH